MAAAAAPDVVVWVKVGHPGGMYWLVKYGSW